MTRTFLTDKEIGKANQKGTEREVRLHKSINQCKNLW